MSVLAPLTQAPAVLSLSGFSPLQLPGLVMWLDAGQISGFADGDPVTTWTDKSGRGNDAAQATVGKKFLYKVNAANGRPGLLSDGVDDFMNLSAAVATALLAGDKTLLMAVKWVVADAAEHRLLTVNNGAAAGRFSLRCSTTPEWQVIYTTGAAQGFTSGFGTPVTTAPQIATVVQIGASLSARLNGGTAQTAADASTEVAGPAILGSNAVGTAVFVNAYFLEVIVCNAGLVPSTLLRATRYLGEKYGVRIS